MNETLTPSKSLLVEKFKYEQFKRKNLDGQRYYVNSNGDPVPSVTSILSKTKDMTALNAWKKTPKRIMPLWLSSFTLSFVSPGHIIFAPIWHIF